ncbi:prealbumin-like fold domain-containing protein [Streptomyces cinnabarinus]|uniref:Prealbumin-like fold domain-containing protein n=1 Tax=Streptomyces cinnabarinus TaxID=67287 RepID=A0ABY7KK54_9ACTN|nr:prealbumin-like fold domain-containing protein [Streptomyces cinnabarinus]WAZ24928.1 prealbumin-like fold domain-containing protein [Streptomyces cinnabarinus]
MAFRTAATAVLLGCGLLSASVAVAQAPPPSLAGSGFEIDTDANLVVDNPNSPDDWDSVAEIRVPDNAIGNADTSFGQGAKEDSAVPSVVDGGIPPNKSDLRFFGVYQEGASTTGFLNMFWSRVQEPTGTTNMDFEFNQSETLSTNGVTPVRTTGDVLITYDLSQGGTRPVISIRTWTGSAWGPATNLTSPPIRAAASINTTAIAAGDSDGLGALDARTFGEAQISLAAVLGGNGTTCKSFASAYLKSRASDAFNSALKDFIPPQSVDISNCGSVQINKTDDQDEELDGAEFTLYKDNAPLNGTRGDEDTATTFKCTTVNGTCTIDDVPQGEYWVHETVVPTGHDPAPDQHVTVVANETETLNFSDPRQMGAIRVTKVRKHAASGPGDHAHEGITFTLSNGATATTDANGQACFNNLPFGTYTVTEGDHAGYADNAPKEVTVDSKASCTDNPYNGETVSFRNTPLTDLTLTAIPQVTGATQSEFSCNGQTATNVTPTSATFPDLPPGTYTCTVVIDP